MKISGKDNLGDSNSGKQFDDTQGDSQSKDQSDTCVSSSKQSNLTTPKLKLVKSTTVNQTEDSDRRTRLEKIRKSIQDGTYDVKAEKIAEKIIRNSTSAKDF